MNRKPLFVRTLVVIGLIWIAAGAAGADTLSAGAGRFTFSYNNGRAGHSIPVHYYMSENADQDSPVIFVMHGTFRNGRQYRDLWIEQAREHDFVLIVPEFSDRDWPGSSGYNLGNLTNWTGRANDPAQWGLTVIEHLFDHLRGQYGFTAEQYGIFGHSAGAQFVHRMVLFGPESRISTAVAANAGWYTMPCPGTSFPYGMKDSPAGAETLQKALGRRLIVLLGDQDNDPNGSLLRRTRGTMAQGSHRYSRGQNFFGTGRDTAQSLQADFNWEMVVVPGVRHWGPELPPAAMQYLLDI